jgi:hypothetical protein
VSIEHLSNQQWLDDNRAAFDRASGVASEIGLQNELYSSLVESGQVTLEPFQDATTEHLTAEQTNTFQVLREAEAAAPYEELGLKDVQLRAAIGSIATQLAEIEEGHAEEAALIRKEEELVAGRIPELAPKLSEIATKLQQGLVAKAKTELQARKVALEAEYESFSQQSEDIGQAWQIPRLVRTSQEEPELGPEEPDDLIEIDDFPEETHITKEQVAEKLHRKYPNEVLREASQFVALFLAEAPKYIYTLNELADVIYGTEEPNRKGRVSALISNFGLGKVDIIGRALAGQGMVFQRGERRRYTKSTGESFGRCHPVFRAVPFEEAENRDRIVHSDAEVDWVNDGWHTIIYDYDTNQPETTITIEVAPEDTTKVPPLAVSEPTIAVDDAEAEMAEEVSDVREQEATTHPPVKERRKRPEPEWKVELIRDVEQTIAQFVADELMQEGTVGWKVVRLKSSSRTLGTETMSERGVNNRIISKAEGSVDSELPISKFICLALQNSHPDTFSNRSRRKQAIALVEQAIADHFESLRKNKPPSVFYPS